MCAKRALPGTGADDLPSLFTFTVVVQPKKKKKASVKLQCDIQFAICNVSVCYKPSALCCIACVL